jgi:hypothetical protein
MNYHASYGDLDNIVYIISDRHIDMWLEEDFNFCIELYANLG